MPVNKTLRKISFELHLWLGLLSGIVLFIVCITGCIYAFKDEINDFNQPWKFISPQEKEIIMPTRVLEISNNEIKDATPSAITYGEASDAVFVDYFSPKTGMSTVYINQYDGQVLKTLEKKPDDFDFFRFILSGHRTLWLPTNIGKPIVGYGVLIFVITLITGVILWWPKKWNKKTIKKNFTFRKNAPLSRINFDIHNVLGGYSVPILLILSLTGLIWSFSWFSESVYYITSGGKELKPYTLPKSDTLNINNRILEPLDKLYLQLRNDEPNATTFYFALPRKNDGVIRVSVVHERGSYYKTDNLFFDQYTLKPLEGSGPYAGKYTEASAADKFRRMNLEIHDGRILGIWGKILAFSASLIGASLPVTGFIIWYRRIKKKRKKALKLS
ncbi:PepSY domain-containing protein [Prevotella sp. 10(H)]|uniref:PepSY-associated TM helix domain-containing protein n=1 Tax=Prevotella sp. 10(H) TaxID=1158294 RepID=UPI0004A6C450|nr:PepSY-associated TM helix domain-containing protein [Prevotella sp. 10(H)]